MEGIAETVEEWFAATATTTEGSVLETMRESALTAARPDATLDIARDLAIAQISLDMCKKLRTCLRTWLRTCKVILFLKNCANKSLGHS